MTHDAVTDAHANQAQAASIYAALEQVEMALAGFYAWLVDCFADDLEAKQLFGKMNGEELRHVEWVRERQARAVAGNQEAPDLHDADVRGVLAAVETFQADNPTPDLAAVVLFVLELEHTTAESHRRIAERSADGANNPLVASLSAADDQHVIDLQTFAMARGIRVFGA